METLATLLIAALSSGQYKEFGDALAIQTKPESFGVLCCPEVLSAMASQMGDKDATRWIYEPLTWDVSAYGLSTSLSSAQQVLHLLWQDLSSRLLRKLDAVGRYVNLSKQGAIHCFFGSAALSIVVEYRRPSAGVFIFRPIDARLVPTAAMELSSMLATAAPTNRNAIKRAAHSVDKIVYQRGIICHVHRNLESDVFGPTIDTIILADIIASWIDHANLQTGRTLELGPGSGLLSALIASCEKVTELTAVELNQWSAACTLKNLALNDLTLDAKHQIIRVRAERFAAQQLLGPFDLVVCNPPYIPAPLTEALIVTEYKRAVGGLNLCLEILANLHQLIGSHGRLLLMVSSVSETEVIAAIPPDFVVENALPDGQKRVPLDVDSVWENNNWRQELISEGRIEQDDKGDLWHELRPRWITKRMTSDDTI